MPTPPDQTERPPHHASLAGIEPGKADELVGLPVTGPQRAGQHALELLHLSERLGFRNSGHAAPPRTGGEQSAVFSAVLCSVPRFLVPFRSLLARHGSSTDPRETPISSAFPRVRDRREK